MTPPSTRALLILTTVLLAACRLPSLPHPNPALRPVCTDTLRSVDACPSTSQPPSAASATVFPGTRVRVVSIERRTTVITGELMRLAGDSITVRSAANQTVSVAATEHFLDVSAGTRRRTWTGIGVGLLVGGVTGYLVGANDYQSCSGPPPFCLFHSRGEAAAFSAAGFAIPAAVIGGFIGHFITREVWQPVDLPPVRVSLVPMTGRGVMLSASMAF